MRPATPPNISSVEEAVAALNRPHDKFIRERFSDMAKNIRDRRLDRPTADEAIEMKTLEESVLMG